MDYRAAMIQSLKDEIAELRKEIKELRDHHDGWAIRFSKHILSLRRRSTKSFENELDFQTRLHNIEVKLFPNISNTMIRLNSLIGIEHPLTEDLDRRDQGDLPYEK